jgi:hypothetical protein
MLRSRLIPFGALTLIAAIGTPLRAQGTAQVQLAFGYECGDRFLVRNDGTQPVLLEYAVAGSQDRSQLHLNGRQSIEIASAPNGNVELWVGGKVVASEPKGNRPCAGSGNAQNSGAVVVRPLDQTQATGATQQIDPTYSAPPVVVYAQPPDYYYPYAYGGFYPYYSYPSVGFYGYGGYGYGGYGYGGYARGGFGHGGIGRGGGGGRTGGRGHR